MAAITGPGGAMGPLPSWNTQPPVVTDLLKAQTDYAKEPTVSNAVALIDKLQELRQAAQQNPALKGAYESACEKTRELRGGYDIICAVESLITPTSAAMSASGASDILKQVTQLLRGARGQEMSVADAVKLQDLVNQLSQAIGSDPSLSRIVGQMQDIIGGVAGQVPSAADVQELKKLVDQLNRTA